MVAPGRSQQLLRGRVQNCLRGCFIRRRFDELIPFFLFDEFTVLSALKLRCANGLWQATSLNEGIRDRHAAIGVHDEPVTDAFGELPRRCFRQLGRVLASSRTRVHRRAVRPRQESVSVRIGESNQTLRRDA